MLFFSYTILAVLVVLLSIGLSKYVDILDRKTEISGAFIGGVLLASVTSLPELFTSITSVAIGSPTLVQGNVFGSNIFNLTILGLSFLLYPREYAKQKISKAHISTLFFTVILSAVCLLGIKYPLCFRIGIFNIEWSSAVIILLYAVNICFLNNDDVSAHENSESINMSMGKIVSGFVAFSIMLVIVSIMLTDVTDKIAVRCNLGSTSAGAIFLGIATSLPELTSSLNLVRLGNFNASFANIVGSNMFNFTILSFGDIIYSKGGMLTADGKPYILIIGAVLSSALAVLSMYTRKKTFGKPVTVLIGMIMMLFYILSIFLSV